MLAPTAAAATEAIPIGHTTPHSICPSLWKAKAPRSEVGKITKRLVAWATTAVSEPGISTPNHSG